MDYALFFCAVGLLGGAIGNTVVGYIIKRYKKTWFVVAILTFVLFMSCFLMVSQETCIINYCLWAGSVWNTVLHTD